MVGLPRPWVRPRPVEAERERTRAEQTLLVIALLAPLLLALATLCLHLCVRWISWLLVRWRWLQPSLRLRVRVRLTSLTIVAEDVVVHDETMPWINSYAVGFLVPARLLSLHCQSVHLTIRGPMMARCCVRAIVACLTPSRTRRRLRAGESTATNAGAGRMFSCVSTATGPGEWMSSAALHKHLSPPAQALAEELAAMQGSVPTRCNAATSCSPPADTSSHLADGDAAVGGNAASAAEVAWRAATAVSQTGSSWYYCDPITAPPIRTRWGLLNTLNFVAFEFHDAIVQLDIPPPEVKWRRDAPAYRQDDRAAREGKVSCSIGSGDDGARRDGCANDDADRVPRADHRRHASSDGFLKLHVSRLIARAGLGQANHAGDSLPRGVGVFVEDASLYAAPIGVVEHADARITPSSSAVAHAVGEKGSVGRMLAPQQAGGRATPRHGTTFTHCHRFAHTSSASPARTVGNVATRVTLGRTVMADKHAANATTNNQRRRVVQCGAGSSHLDASSEHRAAGRAGPESSSRAEPSVQAQRRACWTSARQRIEAWFRSRMSLMPSCARHVSPSDARPSPSAALQPEASSCAPFLMLRIRPSGRLSVLQSTEGHHMICDHGYTRAMGFSDGGTGSSKVEVGSSSEAACSQRRSGYSPSWGMRLLIARHPAYLGHHARRATALALGAVEVHVAPCHLAMLHLVAGIHLAWADWLAVSEDEAALAVSCVETAASGHSESHVGRPLESAVALQESRDTPCDNRASDVGPLEGGNIDSSHSGGSGARAHYIPGRAVPRVWASPFSSVEVAAHTLSLALVRERPTTSVHFRHSGTGGLQARSSHDHEGPVPFSEFAIISVKAIDEMPNVMRSSPGSSNLPGKNGSHRWNLGSSGAWGAWLLVRGDGETGRRSLRSRLWLLSATQPPVKAVTQQMRNHADAHSQTVCENDVRERFVHTPASATHSEALQAPPHVLSSVRPPKSSVTRLDPTASVGPASRKVDGDGDSSTPIGRLEAVDGTWSSQRFLGRCTGFGGCSVNQVGKLRGGAYAAADVVDIPCRPDEPCDAIGRVHAEDAHQPQKGDAADVLHQSTARGRRGPLGDGTYMPRLFRVWSMFTASRPRMTPVAAFAHKKSEDARPNDSEARLPGFLEAESLVTTDIAYGQRPMVSVDIADGGGGPTRIVFSICSIGLAAYSPLISKVLRWWDDVAASRDTSAASMATGFANVPLGAWHFRDSGHIRRASQQTCDAAGSDEHTNDGADAENDGADSETSASLAPAGPRLLLGGRNLHIALQVDEFGLVLPPCFRRRNGENGWALWLGIPSAKVHLDSTRTAEIGLLDMCVRLEGGHWCHLWRPSPRLNACSQLVTPSRHLLRFKCSVLDDERCAQASQSHSSSSSPSAADGARHSCEDASTCDCAIAAKLREPSAERRRTDGETGEMSHFGVPATDTSSVAGMGPIDDAYAPTSFRKSLHRELHINLGHIRIAATASEAHEACRLIRSVEGCIPSNYPATSKKSEGGAFCAGTGHSLASETPQLYSSHPGPTATSTTTTWGEQTPWLNGRLDRRSGVICAPRNALSTVVQTVDVRPQYDERVDLKPKQRSIRPPGSHTSTPGRAMARLPLSVAFERMGRSTTSRVLDLSPECPSPARRCSAKEKALTTPTRDSLRTNLFYARPAIAAFLVRRAAARRLARETVVSVASPARVGAPRQHGQVQARTPDIDAPRRSDHQNAELSGGRTTAECNDAHGSSWDVFSRKNTACLETRIELRASAITFVLLQGSQSEMPPLLCVHSRNMLADGLFRQLRATPHELGSLLALTGEDSFHSSGQVVLSTDYFNPSLSCMEPLLEPWQARALAEKRRDERHYRVKLCGSPAQVNLTSTLFNVHLKLLSAVSSRGKNTCPSTLGESPMLTVANRSGLPLHVALPEARLRTSPPTPTAPSAFGTTTWQCASNLVGAASCPHDDSAPSRKGKPPSYDWILLSCALSSEPPSTPSVGDAWEVSKSKGRDFHIDAVAVDGGGATTAADSHPAQQESGWSRQPASKDGATRFGANIWPESAERATRQAQQRGCCVEEATAKQHAEGEQAPCKLRRPAHLCHELLLCLPGSSAIAHLRIRTSGTYRVSLRSLSRRRCNGAARVGQSAENARSRENPRSRRCFVHSGNSLDSGMVHLVCDVSVNEDGSILALIRSPVRVRNNCAGWLDLVFLEAPPPIATSSPSMKIASQVPSNGEAQSRADVFARRPIVFETRIAPFSDVELPTWLLHPGNFALVRRSHGAVCLQGASSSQSTTPTTLQADVDHDSLSSGGRSIDQSFNEWSEWKGPIPLAHDYLVSSRRSTNITASRQPRSKSIEAESNASLLALASFGHFQLRCESAKLDEAMAEQPTTTPAVSGLNPIARAASALADVQDTLLTLSWGPRLTNCLPVDLWVWAPVGSTESPPLAPEKEAVRDGGCSGLTLLCSGETLELEPFEERQAVLFTDVSRTPAWAVKSDTAHFWVCVAAPAAAAPIEASHKRAPGPWGWSSKLTLRRRSRSASSRSESGASCSSARSSDWYIKDEDGDLANRGGFLTVALGGSSSFRISLETGEVDDGYDRSGVGGPKGRPHSGIPTGTRSNPGIWHPQSSCGESGARLVLSAPYWLINKTGLRLAYHLTQSHVMLAEPLTGLFSARDVTGQISGSKGSVNECPATEAKESSVLAKKTPPERGLAESPSPVDAVSRREYGRDPSPGSVDPHHQDVACTPHTHRPSRCDSDVSAASSGDTLSHLDAPGSLPILLACDASERLVVQVRPYGHRASVGGRCAAVRAPAIRGLVGGSHAPARAPAARTPYSDRRNEPAFDAVGCSTPFALDALGSAGELTFGSGGILGCMIEPAPPGFELLSSSVSVCPRYVVMNRTPAALHLRAEVLAPDSEAPADAPPHVELSSGSSTDIYCFEPLGDGGTVKDTARRDAGGRRRRGSSAAPHVNDQHSGTGGSIPSRAMRIFRFRLARPGWAWSAGVHVDSLDDTFFTLERSQDGNGTSEKHYAISPAIASVDMPLAVTTSNTSTTAGSPPSGKPGPLSSESTDSHHVEGVQNALEDDGGVGDVSGRGRQDEDGDVAYPLLRASVVVRGCTIFVAVSDASGAPPYRIENHSRRAAIFVRQPVPASQSKQYTVGTMGWLAVAPYPRLGGIAPAASAPFNILIRPANRTGSPSAGWRDVPLRDIRELSPLDLPSGRRLHVAVRQEDATRVLVLSDEPLVPATRRRLMAGLINPTRLHLHFEFAAISVTLIEVSPAGAPRELLNGSLRGVELQLVTFPNSLDASLTAELLQLDNMLPYAKHGVLFRARGAPMVRRSDVESDRRNGAAVDDERSQEIKTRTGDDRAWRHGPTVPTAGRPFRAIFIRAVTRSGEFELLSVDLAPLTLALEATVFARLSLLLPRSRAALAELSQPGRSGGATRERLATQLLRRRLSTELEEPPEFPRRRQVYFDQLRISQIDMTVSSALEVQREEAPRQPAVRTSGGLWLGRGGGTVTLGGGGSRADWVAAVGSLPVFSHMLQSMLVLAKGIGLNFGSVSSVPLSFAPMRFERVLSTPQALLYRLAQQVSWQAAAQVGKAFGHSHMLGDPLGAITTVSEGVAGFLSAVGRGFATGHAEHFVLGSRQLMGGLVGGVAGAGARMTASLDSVVNRILREGVPTADPCAGDSESHGRGKGSQPPNEEEETRHEVREPRGKDALRTLGRGLVGLVHKPLRGAQKHGPLGLAQGVADGVWGLATASVAAPLQAGSFIFSTVEKAAMGGMRGNDEIPAQLRPARSFFAHHRLLPLSRCVMASFEVKVVALRCPSIEQGTVHVEVLLYEPGAAQPRAKYATSPRGWLQGFRWGDAITYNVHSLDARLLLRVRHRPSASPFAPVKRLDCLGSIAIRLATIREWCERHNEQESVNGWDGLDGRGVIEAIPSHIHLGRVGARGSRHIPSGSGWIPLRARRRKDALRMEERFPDSPLFGPSARLLAREDSAQGDVHGAQEGSARELACVASDSELSTWPCDEAEPSICSEDDVELDAQHTDVANVLAMEDSILSSSDDGDTGSIAEGDLESDTGEEELLITPRGAQPHEPAQQSLKATPAEHSASSSTASNAVSTLPWSGVKPNGLPSLSLPQRLRRSWKHRRRAPPEVGALFLEFRCFDSLKREEASLNLGRRRALDKTTKTTLGSSLCQVNATSKADHGEKHENLIKTPRLSIDASPAHANNSAIAASTADPPSAFRTCLASPNPRDVGKASHSFGLPSGGTAISLESPVPPNLPSLNPLPASHNPAALKAAEHTVSALIDTRSNTSRPAFASANPRQSPGVSLIDGFSVAASEPMLSGNENVAPQPDACASLLVRVVGHRAVRPPKLGARPYVVYKLAVLCESDTPSLSETSSWSRAQQRKGWTVERRFSQFEQLLQELRAQHPIPLALSGAALPSKFRLPSSLDAEGGSRLASLHSCITRLVTIEALRRSEPMLFFVGAHRGPQRRHAWEAAVRGSTRRQVAANE